MKEYRGALIKFRGIVQGVGFRPFVYRAAQRYNLKGTVKNSSRGVIIQVDGEKESIKKFFDYINKNPPVLSVIDDSYIELRNPYGFNSFKIIESKKDEGFTPISPDIATCDDCLNEVFDPFNRRYLYPFTNCTNCGPRFTIIKDIPYDRKNTTMQKFPMCDNCKTEYENPLDRRYHAQPNACPVCGPELTLLDSYGKVIVGDPIDGCIKLLKEYKIVAIKGLGGFHLALYPFNDDVVNRLRDRKRRPSKPFALMVRDLKTALKYCFVNRSEESLLLSRARPIVLLKRKLNCSIPQMVAPDTDFLGIMLPYTPLHHILMRNGPEILIMTSANISEEPLVYRNEKALAELAEIADAYLINNRDIARPCDDSVTMVVGEKPVLIRRSRGYVPKAIHIKSQKDSQLIAMGPFEKNTFCLIKENRAFVSHHIGDLGNEKSVEAYINGINDFLKMFRCEPQAVICDMHPDYYSTRYGVEIAKKMQVPVYYVQHHHAHIASVLVEKGINNKVIGVAFDGTGYGTDGTIWGGEFLIASLENFERVGYFNPVKMPGGERAVTEIDRMAVSYLYETFGRTSIDIPFIKKIDDKKLNILYKMIELGINSPLTSSCGRLFDAVSSLLELCDKPQYDAQGAILLEREAGVMMHLESCYDYNVNQNNTIDFKPMIYGIVSDIKTSKDRSLISKKFHSTLVCSAIDVCKKIKKERDINIVVLSGGAFQNRNLLYLLNKYLKKEGFEVFTNSIVPPNDGGISLGQAAVGLRKLEKE